MSSWTPGVLKNLFGIGTNTKHWEAVKSLMEQSFGTIKIDSPIEGGKMRAFFEKQTLVGDDHLIRSIRYKHTISYLDMTEPVGMAMSRDAAIIDLWDKMTNLGREDIILQLKKIIGNGEPHARYTAFRFSNGRFINEGETSNECPPTRPQFITDFLAEEKRGRFVKACEDDVFGPVATPSGA